MERFIETISETLGRYVPSVVGAIIIVVLGLLLAKLVHAGLANLLGRTKLDDKLGARASGDLKLSALIASTIFYLLVLYVALIALGVLGIEGVLDPAKAILARFLDFVPNGIAAGLIGLVGYIIARIVSEGVRLAASSLDGFAPKLGLSEQARPSQIIGTIIFVIILVPVLIAALDALKVQAVSGPAIAMLESLLAMGIGEDIVNLAFGLTLGAAAVAFALAFGLGGREAAGQQLEQWLARWRGQD